MELVLAMDLRGNLVVRHKIGDDLVEVRVDALVKDAASAKADTERWEAEAKRLTTNAKVQATLAEACLKREAKAQEEATAIADIMSQTVPKEITPEQIRQGVDDATRKRAADMLNRPW